MGQVNLVQFGLNKQIITSSLITLSCTAKSVESLSLTSGNVSCREGDHELFDLGAIGLRLRDDVLVDGLHRSLEASELGHRVGDLATPQRPDRLVEPADAFFSPNLEES